MWEGGRVVLVWGLLALAAGVGIAGCYVDPEACQSRADCFKFEQCVRGTCTPIPDAPAIDADTGEGDTAEPETGTPGDTGRPDARGPDTGGEDGCSSPSEEQFCEANGSPCDEITTEDRCGDRRTVDCRPFAGGECTCNYKGKAEGVCANQPLDDEQNCKEPEAYEDPERSADDKDNDCDGYTDELFKSLSMSDGGDVVCGLKKADDVLVCWNEDQGVLASNAPSGSFESVAITRRHGCVLDGDGHATCWRGAEKSNWQDYGQVKDVPTSEPFQEISVSSSRTCALDEDGYAECWGITGTTVPSDGDGSRFEFDTIDSGGASDCGLLSSGRTVACWNNDEEPAPPEGEMQMVDAGGYHVCAIRSLNHGEAPGQVVCWGKSIEGDPLDGAPSVKVDDIDVGSNIACAITTSGALTCWDVHHSFESPKEVSGSFVEVEVGSNSVCGLLSDGRVRCWGSVCGHDPASGKDCWAP